MAQTHVLVVDDDEMISQMMGMMLRRLGHKVTLKNNPLEALQWLRSVDPLPDLILCDLMMPEMSGHELIRKIRADSRLSHLPIIILTANDEMEDKIAGFQAGADDYLVKPVNPTELELRINALLSRVKAAPSAPQPARQATVISVFSLRGGVGTSSLAVNLAITLATLWETKVGLMDMALKNGHCALMLNLRPKNTLAALTDWDSDTVDPDTMNNLMLKHESGIELLPAPLSPVEAELVTSGVIDLVWPRLLERYSYLVVDAGSQLVDPVLHVLDRSKYIVLVMAPELASLKDAVDALRVFKQLGYDAAQIIPVVNHTFAQGGLARRNIEAAL
ncbi:MAG: response regulator, partial [Chloroflexi bacterium]